MNLPKLSVKNDIDAQHYVSVKLNKFGEKKANNFGADTYWGNCHVDGVEHMWFISENMHKQITEAGFKEGDTFCVMKWKAGAKMGYNYLSPDDIQIKNASPMSGPCDTPFEAVVEAPSTPPGSSATPWATSDPDIRELSIVTQSVLHIYGYYDGQKTFEQNLDRAMEDAKLLLKKII